MVERERGSVWNVWRQLYGVPINDPRALTITFEAALLDTELALAAKMGEKYDEIKTKEDFFRQSAQEAAERQKARELALARGEEVLPQATLAESGAKRVITGRDLLDLDQAPSVADGNTSEEAARARLEAMIAKARGHETGRFEPVDLDGED